MQGQLKERATLLWMWGRGREGQLGQDSLADSALPCLVPALRMRQVLQASRPPCTVWGRWGMGCHALCLGQCAPAVAVSQPDSMLPCLVYALRMRQVLQASRLPCTVCAPSLAAARP